MTRLQHALAAAQLAGAIVAASGCAMAVQGRAWPYVTVCGAFTLVLLAGCLHTLDDAAERHAAARHAEAAVRHDALDDAFALGWADCARWCCYRSWATHGEHHDPGHCQGPR